MSRNLIASAFALACVATVSASSYTLDASDQYSGSKFFDGFVFKSEPDPTEGYVQYSTQADAASTKYGSKLIDTVNGASYMGVDHTNTYTEDQQGRPSVRIESKRFYNHGLFILDLAHMPASICGTWPAFWTYSRVNYPAQGEIDILENIHEKTASLNVLHTSPGFSVAGNNISKQQTNNQTTYSCDDNATSSPYGTQALKQGCTGTNSDPNSFGSTLNAAGGGVFAMEWTSDVIRVWNFDPKKVPSDVTAGKPEPSGWGLPSFTTAQGTGKIDDHFKDHRIVFDTSFCGLYAGQKGFWEETSCYKKDPVKFATCKSYVGANPEAYKDSYWLIKSLKVYQETGEAPSVPASSLSEASSRIPASSNVPASPNVSASIILSPSLASSTTGSSANVEPGATSISSSSAAPPLVDMNIVPTSTTDEVVTITTLENTTICPKNQSSTAAPIPSYSPQGQHANNRSIAAPSTLAYPTPTESGVWSAGTVSFDSPAISSSTSLLTQTISTCIPTTIYSTIMAPQIASPPESSAPITTAYSVASVSSVSSQEWSISVATSSANSNFGISSDVTSPAATTPATSSSVEKPNFSYNGTSSVASSTGYMPYAPIASPSAPLQVSGARYVGVGNTLAILAFIFAVLV